LGGGDIVTSTTLSGSAVYQCQNQGGNVAPGQNKVLVGPVTDPNTIPAGEIKNGRAKVPGGPVTLTAPSTVSGAQAGCPNPNWTGVNPQLSITSIEFSATQGGVLLFDCKRTGTNLTGTISFTDAECSGVARF